MLRDLQAALAESLLNGDGTAAAHVRDGGLTRERRLEIYRHNVLSNLRGALRDIFPVVNRIVGEAFFLHAADRFIRETPSRSGDLNQFGREWPAFLAGYPHARELPYLPDVARLEWAWHECFHAAEAAPFDLARLAAVPAGEHPALGFVLHPAARLIASPYPLLPIWQVNQTDYTGDMAVDWESAGDRLLVRRTQVDAVDVAIEALPAASFAFLSAIAAGQALEAAAEAALAAPDGGGAFDLQGFLLQSVQSGVIVDFRRTTP